MRYKGCRTAIFAGQRTGAVLIPFIYKSTDNMMIQMLRQLDAGYSTDNGEIQLFNDTTKELLLYHRGTRRQQGLFHLQDFRLSREFSQRRPVYLCH